MKPLWHGACESIPYSPQRESEKLQAREKLRSEEGYELSVRRMVEPESVFGQMKNNRGFRLFLLRCLQKVSLEVICSRKRKWTKSKKWRCQE